MSCPTGAKEWSLAPACKSTAEQDSVRIGVQALPHAGAGQVTPTAGSSGAHGACSSFHLKACTGDEDVRANNDMAGGQGTHRENTMEARERKPFPLDQGKTKGGVGHLSRQGLDPEGCAGRRRLSRKR